MQALLAAPMFEVRFRHVATRALAVMRSSRGKKVPAWIQRLRSQELLSSIFPGQQACFENRPGAIELPDHFVIEETIRECLEESTDLPRTIQLLEGIESGAIRTVTVDAIAPSVFAHRLLLAWDYSFLDDGERANRRSRTVTMNRGDGRGRVPQRGSFGPALGGRGRKRRCRSDGARRRIASRARATSCSN